MRKLNYHIILVLVAALAGCGSDDPTGPTNSTGGITVSETDLDFGSMGAYYYTSRTVTVTADADNDGDVSGAVTVSENDAFSISAGGGAYALSPGQSHQFEVRFAPRTSGRIFEATVQLGVGATTVDCRGFGSSDPVYGFIPTRVSGGTIITNFGRFAGDNVAVLYGTGRSYGERADWLNCSNTGKWILNGNAISESKVGFTFNVPNGVTEVIVSLNMEVESDCVQVLFEIGNEETKFTDLAGCRTQEFTLPISPGMRTIHVGTDNALCSGDLELASVLFRFRGVWVREGEWVDM